MSPFLTTLGGGSARGFGRGRRITAVLGPTSAPSSLSTTANSSTQITISWINGDASAQTQLYRDGVLIATLAAGVTTTTSTGLSAYSSYSFYVSHIKDAITSVNSNTSSATTSPAAPSSLSVNSDSVEQITLYWTNGDAAAQTEIYRNGGLVTTVSAGTYTYVNPSLNPNTSYSYYVRHTRGGLTSTNSNTASGYTYPYAPYSLSATTVSRSQINLTWGNMHSLSTQIYRNGSLLTTVSAGVTTYQSTGLSASTLYSYELIHSNSTSGFSSDPSVAAEATTDAQISGTVTYTASNYGANTYTFTVPSGITQVTCTLVGQGGGGAGGQGSIASGGGGGGAGAIVDRVVSVSSGTNLTVGVSFSYNSATGGNGGQAANDNAADGGNASLQFSGGTLIAYGGSRGRSSSGGAGGAGGSTSTPVGSGGSTSNGSSGQAGVYASRGGNGGSSYFASGGTGASFGGSGGWGNGDGAGGGGAYGSGVYGHSGQGGNGGNAKVIISYSN